MKLSKDKGIELIIAELQKGTATLDILAVLGSKWQLAEKTFYNWLKIAKESHLTTQEPINKQKQEEYKSNEINRLKTQLIDRKRYIDSLVNDIIEIEKIIERGYIAKRINIDGKTELVKEIFKTKELTEWHRTLESKRENLKKIEGWDAPKQIEQKTTLIGLDSEFLD